MKVLKHTIQFKGLTIEYDANALKRWSVQWGLAHGATDPTKAMDAADAILMGKSADVAEKLDDDGGAMTELLNEIAEVASPQAKS
jgi:hypothetical protein